MVNESLPTDIQEATLLDVLARQAAVHADKPAFAFLWDSDEEIVLTYDQLAAQAHAIAAELQQYTQPGDRVLMIYPPGLDFISAFFGCLAAGVIAVPACYPKPRRPMPRLTAIARDARPTVALTTSHTLHTVQLDRSTPELATLKWIETDKIDPAQHESWQGTNVQPEDIAFLQYTSGSTSEPKGVMVTHGNLLHNLQMICLGFGMERDKRVGSGVFWLPAYHDMGLIGGILVPLYLGGLSTLMPPASFLQRPWRWLKAMSDQAATISGAPNFAYDLCVRKIPQEQREMLDLSNWRVAFCGAEPIRAETLRRFAEAFEVSKFSENAFYPCYGLAEATLLVSGGRGPAAPMVRRFDRSSLAAHRPEETTDDRAGVELVGCGNAGYGQQLLIVDPESRRSLSDGAVGEIWVRGPSIGRGYWNRSQDEDATFQAYLADTNEGPFLRTGDLGFLKQNQLFIAGRLKDVIIIRGRNHYPQDIEMTVERAHEALRPAAGAAFSVAAEGEEFLVVVHEIDRHHRKADHHEVTRKIRQAIVEEHDLDVQRIVLIRHGSLPVTTSGKVQRRLCREQYLAGELSVRHQWQRPQQKKPAPAAVNGHPEKLAAANGNGHAIHKAGANGAVTGEKTHTPGIHAPSNGSHACGEALPKSPPTGDEIDRLTEKIEAWLLDWLIQRAGVPQDDVDRQRPFAEYGLDSMTAVEMSQEIEDWLDVRLTATIAWNYPTPVSMSRFLARRALGADEEELEIAEPEGGTGEDFEALLQEIEQLSDDEAEAAVVNVSPSRQDGADEESYTEEDERGAFRAPG